MFESSKSIPRVLALGVALILLSVADAKAGLMMDLPDIYGTLDSNSGFNAATGQLSIKGNAVSIEFTEGVTPETLYMGQSNPLNPFAVPMPWYDASGHNARFEISGNVDASQNVSGSVSVYGAKDPAESASVPLLVGTLTDVKLTFGVIQPNGKRTIGLVIDADTVSQNIASGPTESSFGPKLRMIISGSGTSSAATGMGNFLTSFNIESGTIDAANAVPEPASGLLWAAAIMVAGFPRRRR